MIQNNLGKNNSFYGKHHSLELFKNQSKHIKFHNHPRNKFGQFI